MSIHGKKATFQNSILGYEIGCLRYLRVGLRENPDRLKV